MTSFAVLLETIAAPSDTGPGFSALADLALRLEALGFGRLWVRAASDGEAAFLAGYLVARTTRLELGLLVEPAPVERLVRQRATVSDLAERAGRALAVGLLAAASTESLIESAGQSGLDLLCPASESLVVLAAATRALSRRPDQAGPARRSPSGLAVVLRLDGDDTQLTFDAGAAAELPRDPVEGIARLTSELGDVEVVLSPTAGPGQRRWLVLLESFSRQVIPRFQPLPLLEPPAFA